MLLHQPFNYSPKNKNRELHIWLPDNYGSTQERFPVMYFFDGHNLFSDQEATYGKCWGLAGFLPRWNRPMIVVGMECGHEGNERIPEYCPYEAGGRFWGSIHGMGQETLLWIVREVKPYIDASFRTYSFREACGIGGSSMGGLMALCGICRFNPVFSKAACLSSTISPFMRQIEQDLTRPHIDADTRVYLSFGTEEARTRRMPETSPLLTRTAKNHYEIAGIFSQLGCAVDFFLQDGGRHCEADWEKQVPRFMDFLWNA